MQSTLNYINKFNLPCKVCLNATRQSSFILNSNEFVIRNLINNTDFDFLQTNYLLYPTIIDRLGLSFTNNQRLFSRNGNLFNNVSSYSLISVLSGNNFTFTPNGIPSVNQLLQGSKIDNMLPPALEYYYTNADVNQQNSRVSTFNTIKVLLPYGNEIENLQVLSLNHFTKYGLTEISINQSQFISFLNKERGVINENTISDIWLGNSNSQDKALENIFKYLLIFIPAINKTHIDNIVSKLIVPNPVWEELTSEEWDNLTPDDWNIMLTNY